MLARHSYDERDKNKINKHIPECSEHTNMVVAKPKFNPDFKLIKKHPANLIQCRNSTKKIFEQLI